jgi:hypothetical protein
MVFDMAMSSQSAITPTSLQLTDKSPNSY